MADSVVRLKVDSQEYDNKLKRATDGLTRYADGCRKVGGTLEVVEKETLDFVRAVGQMETTSRSATGKLAEMKKAFTELSMQYKSLTDAEKQSPYGRALAASLDQLKGRISKTQGQLRNVGNEMNNTGGIMGTLKGKFTVNIDAIKLFNIGLQAASSALGVAKDAFFASEASVDEWGRVVDSSKSLYEGFLTAINTGDISGYLGRISQIVQAARNAYDELDRQRTMKTIQAPQMSAQQTENDRMRDMIQTGRYIAPIDGRRATMQNGQQLTAAQIKTLESQLQNGMNKVVGLIGNEVKQTTKAIDAVYVRQGAELGMSVKEFRKGTSSMAEFERRVRGAEQYKAYERAHTTYDERTGISHRDQTVNPFANFKGWDVFRVDGQRYNDLVKLIQQRDQQAGQAYSMQSQAYRTMNRAEGVTLRQIMGGGGSGGGSGSGSTPKTEMQANSESIQKLTQEFISATDERRAAIRDEIADLQKRNETIQLQMDEALGKSHTGSVSAVDVPTTLELSDSMMESFRQDVENKLKENPIQLKMTAPVKDIKAISKAASTAAQVVGSIGDAFNAIEDPAAKVAGTVAQAIATVAMAYAQTLAQESTRSNIWAFIAAAAAATISMAKTIAGIHEATGYAQGGIVEGNTYSGDQIPAMLNAGETVLTAAQTTNVANNLRNNNGGSGTGLSYVTGEQICVVLNRFLRRSGYGEIVTWKE